MNAVGHYFVILGHRYFSGVVKAALSSVLVPVISLLRLFKLPQISPLSTTISLSNKEQFDFFFRTVPPDSRQVQVMYNLVNLFNWTYVSIIYTADLYGESGFKALQRVFEESNSSNICIANSIPCCLFCFLIGETVERCGTSFCNLIVLGTGAPS